MNSFYYGNDQGQDYWINLNHVCFVKPEKDRLILKMSDGNLVQVDGTMTRLKKFSFRKQYHFSVRHIGKNPSSESIVRTNRNSPRKIGSQKTSI
jgi:hypothetical protein